MEVERPWPLGVNANQGDKRGRRKFYGILAAEQSLAVERSEIWREREEY